MKLNRNKNVLEYESACLEAHLVAIHCSFGFFESNLLRAEKLLLVEFLVWISLVWIRCHSFVFRKHNGYFMRFERGLPWLHTARMVGRRQACCVFATSLDRKWSGFTARKRISFTPPYRRPITTWWPLHDLRLSDTSAASKPLPLRRQLCSVLFAKDSGVHYRGWNWQWCRTLSHHPDIGG